MSRLKTYSDLSFQEPAKGDDAITLTYFDKMQAIQSNALRGQFEGQIKVLEDKIDQLNSVVAGLVTYIEQKKKLSQLENDCGFVTKSSLKNDIQQILNNLN